MGSTRARSVTLAPIAGIMGNPSETHPWCGRASGSAGTARAVISTHPRHRRCHRNLLPCTLTLVLLGLWFTACVLSGVFTVVFPAPPRCSACSARSRCSLRPAGDERPDGGCPQGRIDRRTGPAEGRARDRVRNRSRGADERTPRRNGSRLGRATAPQRSAPRGLRRGPIPGPTQCARRTVIPAGPAYGLAVYGVNFLGLGPAVRVDRG